MAKSFFGTDGIRGTVNTESLNSEIALKLGLAAGKVFTRGNHKHRVLIGKDTRISGYMLESALESGFTSSGMDVFLTGPIPTPAVAHLTQALRADLGVMKQLLIILMRIMALNFLVQMAISLPTKSKQKLMS